MLSYVIYVIAALQFLTHYWNSIIIFRYNSIMVFQYNGITALRHHGIAALHAVTVLICQITADPCYTDDPIDKKIFFIRFTILFSEARVL